jgi:hypothetical protein
MTKLLAEYKRKSPWSEEPITERSVREVMAAYDADDRIWGVSLVVDPDWGANDAQDFFDAKAETAKPMLVKGMNLNVQDWIHHGADFVLTYDPGEAIEYPEEAWLEIGPGIPIPEEGYWPRVVVCNNRDTATGELYDETASYLLGQFPRRGPESPSLCAASGYYCLADVPPAFEFAIIGTSELRRLG